MDGSEAMEARKSKKPKQEIGVDSTDNLHPVANNHPATGIVRSLRGLPPVHYTLKIASVSSFINNKIESYVSRAFEAGGYKWKLSLYPNGNKKRNVNGHVSLYLAIAETGSLPLGWEVNVNFRFLVFDHIRDKYLTIQDAEGGIRRFHQMKTEWGFDQLLPLETFNDASNGYLVDDCCVFGAEVFVLKSNSKGECVVSITKDPVNSTYTWKISNFSATVNEHIYSEMFVIGGHKWKLWVCPKGHPSYNNSKGKYISFFLSLADCEILPSECQVHAEYKLRIRDQVRCNHYEKEAKYLYSSLSRSWGFPGFLPLSDLNNFSKGFMVNDDVIVELEITLISDVKFF